MGYKLLGRYIIIFSDKLEEIDEDKKDNIGSCNKNQKVRSLEIIIILLDK